MKRRQPIQHTLIRLEHKQRSLNTPTQTPTSLSHTTSHTRTLAPSHTSLLCSPNVPLPHRAHVPGVVAKPINQFPAHHMP